MVVDLGVPGLQGHGVLQGRDRVGIVAELVVGPAQGIDIGAFVRLGVHRPLDQLHALLDLLPAVHPGVAEVVQDLRLIGP